MRFPCLSPAIALILTAAGPGHAIVIGVDQFDYPDGTIAGQDGGTFWNWRNRAPAVRTAGTSDWDNTEASPTVAGGRLVTRNSAVKREYNGPGEGNTVDIDRADGLGAISAFDNGTVSFGQHTVYFRVTFTTGPSIPQESFIGLASLDFGTERVIFGKLPDSMTFGIGEPGTGTTNGATVIQLDTTYTLVAKLDFGNGTTGTASLFLNPDINAAEPAPLATRSFNAGFWSTAVRLSSGGGTPVLWDDLVVATTWNNLRRTVVTTAADEDNGSLVPAAGGGTGVSLREAVAHSPADSLVVFAPSLSGQTITLTHPGGDMAVQSAVTVDASSLPGGLTVDGNNTSRHFHVGTGGSLTLGGLTLTGGNGNGANGGSIFVEGTLRLHHCTFTGNASTMAGGAIDLFSGVLSATGCTFAENTARDSAIWYDSDFPGSLSHCTVTGNSSTGPGSTGGISVVKGTLALERCTIARNIGNGGGGGLYMVGPATVVNVHSSIIAGNSDPGGIRHDVWRHEGTLNRSGFNLIGNPTGVEAQFPVGSPNANGDHVGTATAPLDPRLSPPGWFGGPVRTMHPLIGSPAIDSAEATDPGGTDARGFPRFVDGDANESSRADIGAVEAGPLVTVASAIDSGDAASLRGRISAAAGIPGARIGFLPGAFPGGTVITLGGTELAVPATPGLFIDASNLSGPVTLSGDSRSRVFDIPAMATVAMHSLRIVAGKAADGATGTPTTAGQPGADGGGIRSAGSLSLFSCDVSGNRAGNGGSHGLNGQGLDNNVDGGNGGKGGGISSAGPLVLSVCSVSGNTSGRGGNSRTLNSSSGGSGGGIFCDGPTRLSACTLSGNTGGQGGTRIGAGGGRGGDGGAISSSGALVIMDSTLSGNNAGDGANPSADGGGRGGGIFKQDAMRFHLANCTVADNRSGTGGNPGQGAGIFGATLTLRNCVIAGNIRPGLGGDNLSSNSNQPLLYIGANLLGTAPTIFSATGPAPIIADPLLAPLDDYGGPTRTMALRPGSPALNAGTVTVRATDQRGFPVVGLPDIGAYEAGTHAGYNAHIWETLPANATADQHAATADYDGDGAANGDEFIAGTLVMDPGSAFRIKQSAHSDPSFSVTFPTRAGRTYRLLASPDLKDPWIDISGPREGTGADMNLTVTVTGFPRYFFRIGVGTE
ncbi:hypothetical protein OVA24_12915 [Luteolibacter sp. SL250]|uniref:choice-of-anchor Q domain-containing protein n=1 Tax=Luteolibacter sp. SL250 TaxID=2995170 RepID=UPI002271D05A|nr:choice-of-anchor Q domain-containing protein [Luteolibacter sp. SL250]WAC18138.1 hypothetical protein OVA24_12915 [Luteolibacter sp. SL250]